VTDRLSFFKILSKIEHINEPRLFTSVYYYS